VTVSFTTVIDKWVHVLVRTNSLTDLSLIANRKTKYWIAMSTSDVAETASFETETSSDIPRPRLEIRNRGSRLHNLCIVPKFLKIMSSSLLSWIFSNSGIFRTVLVVSYLQIQETKNSWIIEILLYHFFAISKVSRPVAFETRPDTFETETGKNGSRDRDEVSRLITDKFNYYFYHINLGCIKLGYYGR